MRKCWATLLLVLLTSPNKQKNCWATLRLIKAPNSSTCHEQGIDTSRSRKHSNNAFMLEHHLQFLKILEMTIKKLLTLNQRKNLVHDFPVRHQIGSRDEDNSKRGC